MLKTFRYCPPQCWRPLGTAPLNFGHLYVVEGVRCDHQGFDVVCRWSTQDLFPLPLTHCSFGAHFFVSQCWPVYIWTTNNFKPVITYFCHQRSSAMSQLTKHVILKKIFNFSHDPVFNKHICICCSNLFHQKDISLACLVPRYLSPYVLKLNFACHLIFSSY